MASLAEMVANAKDGLAQRLATTAGLTPADGVRVASATVLPDELASGSDVVELGDVLVGPSPRPDLVGREARPTLNGWVTITRPVGDEEAIWAARRRAAELMGLVEAAVKADPFADGAIAGPGGTSVAISGLTETPADWNGQAVRRASYPFTITWTSHVT